MSTEAPILECRGVRKHYSGGVRAVDGVDLAVQRGEILGLVGESGSGKSTLTQTLLGLTRPTAGSVLFEGVDITKLRHKQLRRLRRGMQIVFQDAQASLNPRQTVVSVLREPYQIHRVPTNAQYRTEELLEMVGLPPRIAAAYPHQLSGGQARRVGIARALTLKPALLVADEPTAGLDVTIAAEILMLLMRLQESLGLTYIIVTHDLNLVGYAANRIAVMYAGKLVEVGSTDPIFNDPAHPYTRALLAAVPDPTGAEPADVLGGEVPDPRDPPSGCRFHPRCRWASDVCVAHEPLTEPVGPEQAVACHRWKELALPVSLPVKRVAP